MAVEEGPAIGIDLGTTYSCVAYWKDNTHVEIITNERGQRTTPSMVGFTNEQILIGEDAKRKASSNAKNTVFDVKRMIGRTFNDECVQQDIKRWPFNVISGDHDKPMMNVTYKGEQKQFTAEEISSMVLKKMKEAAERCLETEVKNAVITVPAYFNDAQRQTTKIAGKIAGLNVMRIINEPTAAAFAYALDKKTKLVGKKNLLIFDLGGGTFDVSIMKIHGETFEVIAVSGDTHLGGQDFDYKLVEHCVEQFKRLPGKDITLNERARSRLKHACEKAKIDLSTALQCSIDIESLYDGNDFSYNISRATFDELNKDLFNKCIGIVKSCLKDVNMEKSSIDRIVLVGGSTRIPKIQEMIQEFFERKEIFKSINQDEAVAYGAAVQAAILVGDEKLKNLVLRDVIPLSLGVRIKGEVVLNFLKRNTTIPCSKEDTLFTSEDNQRTIGISVYEGERTECMHNNLLGQFTISGIPPARVGKGKITVCFDIDENGILTVSANCKAGGTKNSISITNEMNTLSEEAIKRMIRDAERYKVEDEEYRKKVAAKNDLEQYAHDIRNSVADDDISSLIPASTKDRILKSVDSVLQWLPLNEHACIDDFNSKKEELRVKIEKIFKPTITGGVQRNRAKVLSVLGKLVTGLHIAGAVTGVVPYFNG